jgi:hypothetical protein
MIAALETITTEGDAFLIMLPVAFAGGFAVVATRNSLGKLLVAGTLAILLLVAAVLASLGIVQMAIAIACWLVGVFAGRKLLRTRSKSRRKPKE